MGWRDHIVTSFPKPEAPATPATGGSEDIEDFGPRYGKKNSLSIENSLQKDSQDSTCRITPSISSKLTPAKDMIGGPTAPLQPGWLVVYRDRAGTLCGGCDERQHRTVQGCRWDGSTWTVTLTDGQTLPLRAILSVGKTDAAGRVVAAWTVRTHGYDGEGTR